MKYMRIELFRLDGHGEREGNCGTVDYYVKKIEIEEDHYKITSIKDMSGEEITYNVPVRKYEIQINAFI